MTGTTFTRLSGAPDHCAHCGTHIGKHTIGSYYCPLPTDSWTPKTETVTNPDGSTTTTVQETRDGPKVERPGAALRKAFAAGPTKFHMPEKQAERVEDHPLYPIFRAAIEQAMFGKGERHGGARTPFLDQPWVHYLKMHGRGFATGQAAKKLEEAASTREGVGFETEVFGAIVYAGMAILKERGEV